MATDQPTAGRAFAEDSWNRPLSRDWASVRAFGVRLVGHVLGGQFRTVADMTNALLETLEPRRRRPAPTSEHERLFTESLGWRKHLLWRIRDYVPDAAAEIDAIVWELIAAGESDHACLYWSTVSRLRRLQRRALARRSREQPSTDRDGEPVGVVAKAYTADFADEVTARVAAAQIVARLPAPSSTTRPWIDRAAQEWDGRQPSLPSTVRSAGARWSAAAREQIAVML